MSRDRGLPFAAIPVFPHRRFRHGFIFINTTKSIATPADLIGKRIGVTAYQATALVWLRGILESEYAVPHRSIAWFSELDEDIPFTHPEGLRLTRLPPTAGIAKMLAEGELDAVLHTDMIAPFVKKDPRVARLFPDHKATEIDYHRKTGIFPIMHVLGLRAELLAKHPWVAQSLYDAFEQSKTLAFKRAENPRNTPLAWYQEAWEEQHAVLGNDPYAYGLSAANRHNLATLIAYSHAQGLIRQPMPPEDLFTTPPS
jgi:4,5-dihydroxyphthalate decarboxylase